MFKKYLKKRNLVFGLFLAALLILSFNIHAEEKEIQNEKSVSIGVIPFQVMIPENELSNTVICPLCVTAYSTGRILTGAEKTVEDIFVDKIRDFKEVKIISRDKVQGIYKRVSAESFKKPLLEVLKKVGDELGADMLAVGYIYRYTERVGYDYSTKRPASVAFEIYMIDHANESIVWRGIFDKTQKSLMEDLFQISSFVKGGGKWLTAKQLTKQGMDEIFEKFPGFVR